MTVLVAYVPTPEGDAAYAAGLAEAERRKEKLLVLNAARDGAPVSSALAPEHVVADMTALAAGAGIDLEVRQESFAGDPSDGVLQVALDVDASVIVIGLRRRSPVGKLLMGSSAQHILLAAARPVLAVKA